MKRFLSGVLAGATVLTLTVGCTVQRFGPKLQIMMASQDLALARKAGFTVRAGGRVEDLIAVVRKETVSAGHTFTAEDAAGLRRIYNSSLKVAWDMAGNGAADNRSLTKVVIDGIVGVETRQIGDVTYVRVPFRKVAAKFGLSKTDINTFRNDLGPNNAGVPTLVEGGWVWISAADIDKFAQNAGVGAPPSKPNPAMNQKFAAIVATSAQNLLASAKVTYDRNNKHHLIFTTSTAKMSKEANRLTKALEQLTDQTTADLLDKTLASRVEKASADTPIVLDLWIDNGRFTAMEINLLQFVQGGTGRAGVRIEFSRGLDVAAPATAAKFDLNGVYRSMTHGGAETLLRAGVRASRAESLAALVGS